MKILKYLIVLILIIASIGVSNGSEAINEEDVEITKTVKPVITKNPASPTIIEPIEESSPLVIPAQTKTPTKTTEQTLPPKQTVAPNDVPTYKPVYTKSPNFEPLNSLPPTMPPPKTGKPTTIATKEPVETQPPKTQAPVETEAPKTEAPQENTPKNTKKPSSTPAPETPKPTEAANSFELETTHVPVIPTKKPKSNSPTNSIPTFSESSYGLGDLESDDSSNSLSIFKFKSIFTLFISFSFILFI